MVALDDLDRVRHPLDAFDQRPLARRLPQPEADLRLDARIHQAGERYARPLLGRAYQRAVVDRPPDRLVDAIPRPDRAIGEADLASDGPPSGGKPVLVQRTRRLVAGFGGKAGITLAERRDLARRFVQRDQLASQHPVDSSGWLHGTRTHATFTIHGSRAPLGYRRAGVGHRGAAQRDVLPPHAGGRGLWR